MGARADQHSAPTYEAAFRETADPGSYVPRVETESILKQLESAVLQPDCPAGLLAGPGMGKSILLHVLAERLGGRRRCVFLAYGSLCLTDLCAWALGRMDEPRAKDPVEALLSLARGLYREGSALVLLIDDASGMQRSEARRLGGLWSRAGGALQLVLATPDDARGDDTLAAVGHGLRAVELWQAMNCEETGDLVRGLLGYAGVPQVTQNRFDRDCIEWIHAQSGGVPRLAQRLGQFVLVDQPADVTPSWHHNHDWLGLPLDELSSVDQREREDEED